MTYKCQLCGKADLHSLLHMGEHPIAHHYLSSLESGEKAYVHPFHLGFCEACGLFQLIDPIPPDKFYANYITLSSWKHQPHIPHLIDLVNERIGADKSAKILEAGSNDGIFLKALRKAGYSQLLGIEPAQDARESARSQGFETLEGYFNPSVAKALVAERGQFQLFIARQVLEHVQDLTMFSEAIRIALAPGGYVLIEVPAFECNLRTPDYSLWEEHVNYFTLETLNRFLAQTGLKPLHDEVLLFSGETLVVLGQSIAKPSADVVTESLESVRAAAHRYRDQWPVFKGGIAKYLADHKNRGGRTAIYGAGARLATLVNFAEIGPYIEYVVDDQPEKQGKFMPGSNLAIVPSEMLEKGKIDLCLLAVNTESEDKVIAKHADWVRQGGQFFSVLPPSDRLLPVWNNF